VTTKVMWSPLSTGRATMIEQQNHSTAAHVSTHTGIAGLDEITEDHVCKSLTNLR